MVHAEPINNKKKYEEGYVQVVTRWGDKKGEYFEHGEGSGQKPKGNFRNENNLLLSSILPSKSSSCVMHK
jgi:hypothetical protein